MTEASDLPIALWEMFRGEICTGDPVFFSFSQETLRDHLSETVLAGRSPLEAVCAAARACIDIHDTDVFLRPGVLSRGNSGFSMAIVLVCQQVLAVEEMVNDGSRYSENAYFPRLRSLISPALAQLSQNPFGFQVFESIWRTFAGEIRRISGSTDETITFEFGSYSGINKARLFPLSQALLSRADLSELLTQCRSERLRTGSAREIWIEIYRERAHLSRRGQRLVNSGFLRDRLIEQVQRYARRASVNAGSRSSQLLRREAGVELAICLDVSDWASEGYAAFLATKGAALASNDERGTAAVLSAALGDRGYVFCALGDLGDYWSFSESPRQVERGETMLLLGTPIGIERGRAILDGLSPSVALDDHRMKVLGTASNVRVCPVTLPMSLEHPLIIKAGRIAIDPSQHVGFASYEWLGGVCVDRRARKYLRQALPAGIRFGRREFRIQEVNRVGDAQMGWGGFERAIQKLEVDASYELRFGPAYVARLSIAVERNSAESVMGFLVDGSGLLSPTLDRVGEKDAGVVGFSQRGIEVGSKASARTIGLLLRDLKANEGRLLEDHEMQSVIGHVERSAIPHNVKHVIKQLISRGAKVRDETLSLFAGDRPSSSSN